MLRNIQSIYGLARQRLTQVPQKLTSISTKALSTSAQRLAKQQATNTSDSINNEPVQFFGSNAAAWRAKDTRSGGADETLWYQPYVVSGSVAIFLIYFCILREESDIDQKLEGTLFDHVNGLEEIQLSVSYKYNLEHNLDNTEVEARLNELGIDVKSLTN